MKWFTIKNSTKSIKMFMRSSKRITKIRQTTPHAMCRHMVEVIKCALWCSEWKRQKVSLDDAGWSAGAGTRAPSAEQLIHMFDLQLPGFAVTPFQPNDRADSFTDHTRL